MVPAGLRRQCPARESRHTDSRTTASHPHAACGGGKGSEDRAQVITQCVKTGKLRGDSKKPRTALGKQKKKKMQLSARRRRQAQWCTSGFPRAETAPVAVRLSAMCHARAHATGGHHADYAVDGNARKKTRAGEGRDADECR